MCMNTRTQRCQYIAGDELITEASSAFNLVFLLVASYILQLIRRCYKGLALARLQYFYVITR